MPTILCAEDDPAQTALLRISFERAGFTVISAENGQEAIDLTQKYKPDIILMDLMMPLKNGEVATKEIKNNPDLNHIPIMLYTAYDKGNAAQKAIDAGAIEVIPKTISPRTLVQKINQFLRIP